MEVSRQIETHFSNLESGQKELTEKLNTMQGDIEQMAAKMTGNLAVMGMKSAFLQEEMAALRGAFAGVEALLGLCRPDGQIERPDGRPGEARSAGGVGRTSGRKPYPI